MKSLFNQVRWILGHWRPYKALVPALAALTLANAAVLVAYPYFLKQIIDSITQSVSHRTLFYSVAGLSAVGILRFAIYATLQTIRTRLNMSMEYAVRLRAFEHLQQLDPGFFARFRTGDLVTRLIDDVNDKLSWYMCSGIFRVFEAAAIIVFGVAMMLSISPELTLYAAGPLPILVGLFVATAQRLHRRYESVQASISKLNDSLETCFSGIRVVKAFAVEPLQQAQVEAAIDRQRRAEIRAVRWQTVIDSLYGNIWQLAVAGVLLAGGVMAIDGKITLGDIVAFEAYVLLLVWPMFDIGQFLVRGRLSAVCIDRINALETAVPEIAEPGLPPVLTRTPFEPDVDDTPSPPPERRPRTVSFENVAYRYPGSIEPAVADVSFAAAPGRITAIAGPIGSGKSTLLALVPRLIDPTAGQVTVNGQSVRDVDLRAHRQRIGYAPQEATLFSGTIEENIRFGRTWVSDEQLRLAVEVAQLEPDAKAMPAGLETVIGSRGVRLSGGQKQRVAVARALASAPEILLLDDCTASLDAETERRLWERLFDAFPQCTILAVTHRPATLQRADFIVLLEAGTSLETGSFSQLHRPGTRFHDLYLRWEREERS